jgi:PPOX class probable F420-dependent enzyme
MRATVVVMIDQLSDEALALIDSAAIATVVTLNADGSPHISAAWIGLEDGELVFGTIPDQRKLRNLRGDPRIAITLQGERVNVWGLREYLVIDGTARVTEGGAPELLQRLARTYLGPDVVFPAMPNPPPGFVTRITIERVSGIGPWRRTG